MNNDKAITFFENMATSAQLHPNSVKMAKNSDFSDLDTEFIRNYAESNSTVLDLGTGTGLIVNKLYPYVKSIVAVEPFPQFTKYITPQEKIRVFNQTVTDFSTNEKFDLVCFFGVMQYFEESQAKTVYEKYIEYLDQQGTMIIKNQFGLYEDVTVDGYSAELQKDYFAQYRQTSKEVQLLHDVGFTKVEVIDIYPKECNRWNNTHFFALVAKK